MARLTLGLFSGPEVSAKPLVVFAAGRQLPVTSGWGTIRLRLMTTLFTFPGPFPRVEKSLLGIAKLQLLIVPVNKKTPYVVGQ